MGDGGDRERERGWVMVFLLPPPPQHSKPLSLTIDLPPPRHPSSGAPAVASYFTHSSLSLRYQSSYHKHFARPLTLGLMRRESNLNMNSFSPPLCRSSRLSSLERLHIRIPGSELILSRYCYVDWNGEHP